MTHPFQAFSPTTLADVLSRGQVMDIGIHALWDAPRIAGPAFTVRCPPGDNLMLHAAIYRAPAGSVLVVESADCDFAVAGGNVCAVAQRHGIVGLVVDGVIRDLGEVRQNRFPVYARGVSPVAGGKHHLTLLNHSIRCGGVAVSGGDIVVADEEGIVVVPRESMEATLQAAEVRAAQEANQNLDAWEATHRAKIEEILRARGFKSDV